MKIFLTILALSSLLLFSSDDSQYAQTIRETAKAMGYQLSEDELEMWIERLKSYNSNDIEKFDDDINAFVEQDFINPPKKNEFLFHAGTVKQNGEIYAIGGRVLNFVSISEDYNSAKKNVYSNLEKLNWNKGIRQHSYPDEEINLGIDFDGVIHNNDKGFYDGTIYGDPVDGTEEALKKLSDKYTLICYTAKAKPDRMLINGKTGTELVWEWLKKHNFDKYISKVTSEKPRAVAYIDDKAIRFSNWDHCFASLEAAKII